MEDVVEAVTAPLRGKKSTKYFLIAGAGLGLVALIYKRVNGSATPAQSVSSTETAAGSPYLSDSTATQINSAMQSFAEALGESNQSMLETLGENNQALLETIAASNAQNAQAFQSVTSALADLKSSTADQIANVYDTVHEITYSAPSYAAPTSNKSQAPSEPDKPTVAVARGSVEERSLRDMYGDRVNIVYASENQFQGNDRGQTNAQYVVEIAKAGVSPIKNVDLESYKDPYGGHVNG